MNDPLGLFEDDAQDDPLGLFGGSPKVEPTEKNMRVERVQQFYKDVGGGALETIGAVGSNMLLAPLAGLAGLANIGGGVDKAVEAIGSIYDKGYQPKTDVGKAGTENVSDVLNLPAEYGGKLGEAIAGNEGRLVGEIAGEFATDLLPFGALKRGKGKAKAPEAPKLDTIEKRLEAMVKRDPSNPATGPITDTRTGAQLSKEAYDAALREKELQRTSAFNRPDQFPDMVQESPMDRMVRDLGGEPNVPATPDSVMGRMADDLTTERSTLDQRAAQDLIEQRQAQLEQDMRIRATPELQAAERARQEQAPAVSPEQAKYAEEQRMVAEARQAEATRIQEQQRALEQEQRDLDAAELMKFKRDQIQRDIDTRQAQLEQDVRVQRLRDEEARIRSMLGERATPDQLRSQEMLAQANRPQVLPDPNNPARGVDATSPEVLKRLQQEELFTNRPQTDEMVRERRKQESDRAAMEARLIEIEQELRDTAYRPVGNQQGPKTRAAKAIGQRGFANSQTGAIMLPFGKKPAVDQLKKIEGIKNDPQMRNIFPETLSVEEVIKEHAALKTPDVDQNGLQRLMNHLTKGSLYQAIKTDNPIVRVVGEKIRQANNYAMEATGRLVHDGLAPLAQKLSKQEKADVWAVQQMAEAKGVELTPEFLREEGFNQKQIDWVTEHKSVMDDMYSRMSDSMKAAGLEPVSARVAYVASRARGDFRRLIMKDKKVVGIMGDNTRMGLNKQIERLKKDHPEYEIGQERYYGGRAAKGTEEGFMQMLDFLSKDNPDFKLFVNHVNDMLSQDAFQYMNAKSHTMQKKRIEGMEGRKLYADAVKNAEEGMQAQIRYAETMIKWSELSKAIAEVKPLLKQDNGLDMPNAKEWANEYIQGALGNSPGKLGDALDSVTAAIGKGTGIGTTIPARAVSAMKSYVNGVLLGFGNVGFLTANAIQLPRTMPEMAAWLNTKGIEAGYDLGLGRALISVQKQLTKGKLTDLERGAFEYAKKNHVYSSNLFESGNTVSKGLSYYWQKGTQFIASPLERETRKVAFFAYTHMLDEAGFKPGDGLYEAAQNLTDMHMNNYAQAEAPRVYQETGGIGRSAYNLMSFKHNELSRLAMFAREIPKGQGKPILTAMASQIAFAGLIGTLGYAEADALYEKITAMMGEPTSLTKILLDNPEIPDALKFGMGSLADVDLTNRMGLQLTPGSMIDLLAPGFGKLGDIGGAVGEMVSQPNLYNAANVAREALPLSVGGIMDRTIFETEDGMALNRNKVTPSATRNDADKLWKALGMTGVNESVQKKLSYENQKIDQVYKDKRSKVIDGAIKEYYMRGVLPDNWVERYIELQGNPKEAKAAIQARIEALNVDRPTKELMQNAASKSISSQHKLLRRLGME